MIVILCQSFEEAELAYGAFLEYLYDQNPPYIIRKQYDCSNCVETDEDLRYIFIDQRYQKLFQNMDICVDFDDVEDFFYNLYEY